MKKNHAETTETTPAEKEDPRQEPATPAADSPRQSERLAAAISAAETRLTALHDTDLPALEKERDALAGSLELDDGAVKTLSQKRALLLDEASTLRRRIELLTEKKEAAEKEEATARMSELTRELKDLAASGAGLKEQWDTLLTSLLNKSKEFFPVVKRSQELAHEKEWLKTRYSIDLLPSDGLTRPTTQELRPLEKSLDDLGRSTLDPWLTEKRDLLDARARALPKPQGVYESRLFTVPEQPTAPATPPQPPPAETPARRLTMADRFIRKEG